MRSPFHSVRYACHWLAITASLTMAMPVAIAQVTYSDIGVMVEFQNLIEDVQMPANPTGADTAILFGGTTAAVQNIGTANYELVTVSFGQPFAEQVPYANFVTTTIDEAKALLYVANLPDGADPLDAAFSYKTLLWECDDAIGTDPELCIRARFEDIDTFWDPAPGAEGGVAQQAAELVLGALRFAPRDAQLWELLLDIYYDTAVANLAAAQEKLVKLAQIPITNVAPLGGFKINDEIELLEPIVLDSDDTPAVPALMSNALQGYLALLTDPLGVDIGEVTTDFDGPLGYYIFQQQLPSRSLNSPLLGDQCDENNQCDLYRPNDATAPATAEPLQLFDGYKDLVLMLQVEREYARAARKLARRYIMRNNPADLGDPGDPNDDVPDDFTKARQLIDSALLKSKFQVETLLGVFPTLSIDSDVNLANSGAVEALGSWRHALRQLSALQTFIEGDTNLLGFPDDFLLLIQRDVAENTQTLGNLDYAYDRYAAYLAQTSPVAGPLTAAVTAYDLAQLNYTNYRDREDQLAGQFQQNNQQFNTRLVSLSGLDPIVPGKPCDVPESCDDSEIYIQLKAIEGGQLRIEQNYLAIENLQKEIEIEIGRRGKERNINDAISTVYIDYGNRQAKLSTEIAKINAAQAMANGLAQAVGAAKYFGEPSEIIQGAVSAAAFAGNASFQHDQALKKGQLQAQKDRLAAAQSAEINSLNDDLLENNFQAWIKTRWLAMGSLVLDSQIAGVALQEETGRLNNLYSEKINLERQMAESNENLTQRYFADPSHRLFSSYWITAADISFEAAQRWLYFTLRAWEYKRNRNFLHTYSVDGKTYSRETIFKLRNAMELEAMLGAMDELENSLGGAADVITNFFLSFRKDLLDYDGPSVDPVTGQPVTDAQAFNSFLQDDDPADDLYLEPGESGNPLPMFKVLKLDFSTAFRRNNFFSLSRYLEKIISLDIKLVGAAATGCTENCVDGFTEAWLTYGGASLINNEAYGVPGTGDEADRCFGETTTWSTKHYKFVNGEFEVVNDAFQSAITALVSDNGDIDFDAFPLKVLEERSVAATNWSLYLPVEDNLGNPQISIKGVTVPETAQRSMTDIRIKFRTAFKSRDFAPPMTCIPPPDPP